MRLNISVSDEVNEKLNKYSKIMGVPKSSLCTIFIGQGLMSYDKAIEALGLVADKAFEQIEVDEK